VAYAQSEIPEEKFVRLEKESDVLFRAWRTAYYRTVSGELKTTKTLDSARENMEAAVIAAGNAYRELRNARASPQDGKTDKLD
jgi:uncharacterized FlgJ-related protein